MRQFPRLARSDLSPGQDKDEITFCPDSTDLPFGTTAGRMEGHRRVSDDDDDDDDTSVMFPTFRPVPARFTVVVHRAQDIEHGSEQGS